VRLAVNNYDEVKMVKNVIGYIRGSEEPGKSFIYLFLLLFYFLLALSMHSL
jgi:hypothetical protein